MKRVEIQSIARTATLCGFRADERKPAGSCANYLENQKADVHDDTYLAAAWRSRGR